MTPIRVLVADDHPVLREGVAAMLANQPDMALVGEARSGADAVALYGELAPDVVLMDLQMPGMNGVEAIRVIRETHPEARILVLTTYAGDAQALRALRAGARGYILKSGLRTDMLDAIRRVSQGARYIHRDVADEIALHAVDGGLSEREAQVLTLVAQGQGNKEIGRSLGLSAETVKGHLKTTFVKLGVTDRTHAVTVALRRGIIDP